MKEKIIREFRLPKGSIFIDSQKLRLLTSERLAKRLSKKVPNCAIVKEYPTFNGMELEVDFL